MARIIPIVAFVFALCCAQTLLAQGDDVVPGLITGNNVDITADSGEILSDRLSVGATIYIVTNPKEDKKGWVRVSRSPSDKVGVGWIESKYIRPIPRWKKEGGGGGSSYAEPAPEPKKKAAKKSSSKYAKIGVLPFVGTDLNDPTAAKAYDAFLQAMEKQGRFQVISSPLRDSLADIESPDELKGVLKEHKLDGIFVGNVSPEIAGSRLVQVRFLGKSEDSFAIEKVKKVSSGALQGVMDELASSCADDLASK